MPKMEMIPKMASVVAQASGVSLRTPENSHLGLSPSTSSQSALGPYVGRTYDLVEDEDRQPFYVGMRGVERKFSLCKEVREMRELDKLMNDLKDKKQDKWANKIADLKKGRIPTK